MEISISYSYVESGFSANGTLRLTPVNEFEKFLTSAILTPRFKLCEI